MTATPIQTRWLWLVPVFLLGFYLTMDGLLDESLWADEGWTIAATAEANPLAVVTEWVAVDVHPPLFFVGLNVWRAFTGDTIFEMRYYAVLLTLLGIAIAYRMGAALFGQRAGLLTALFYALHDLTRVLTQEVRHYPQQILLSALVPWLYWRFWQRPSRGRGIAFVLAGAALLYTHYWGGFLLLALAVHALITTRAGRLAPLRPFIITFGAIGLLYLPWLPALYGQITLERPGGLPHALENTFWVYKVLAYQLIGRPEWFWIILMLVGATGFIVATRSTREATRGRPYMLPSAAALVTVLIVVLAPVLSVLLNVFYPTLSFRALAVVVPAVLALAAYGLAQFRSPEQHVITAFVVIFSIATTGATPITRPPWPEVAAYVESRSTAQDIILNELDTDEHAFAYYVDDTGIAYSQSTREYHPDTYDLDALLDGHGGVWVAKLGWPGLETEYDIRPDLRQRGYVQSAPEIDYGLYIDRPILLWRFDRPVADAITTYGDELRLMRADTAVKADGVTVNLLWSPLVTPTQEYRTSVILFGAGGNVNNDHIPLDGRSPMTTWTAGGWYFDSHHLADIAPGTYRVGVQVYAFTDETFSQTQNLPAADCSDDPDCRFVIVGEVVVE